MIRSWSKKKLILTIQKKPKETTAARTRATKKFQWKLNPTVLKFNLQIFFYIQKIDDFLFFVWIKKTKKDLCWRRWKRKGKGVREWNFIPLSHFHTLSPGWKWVVRSPVSIEPRFVFWFLTNAFCLDWKCVFAHVLQPLKT